MTTVDHLCAFLDRFAPPALAADWDNVGLLVGRRDQVVQRVMTCLTITPAVAAEAFRARVNLIVSHHPLPFRRLKRLTSDDPTGRILLDLIRADISVHSPHTAFDSATLGINQQLAGGLGLTEIQPLEPAMNVQGNLGAGRFGQLTPPLKLVDVAERLKDFLHILTLHVVGDLQSPISKVAVACGSAGEFLDVAIRLGCQVLITGETRLHTCYDAEARGIALILAGHYASERFGVEHLAQVIAAEFSTLTVWASRDERDPLKLL